MPVIIRIVGCYISALSEGFLQGSLLLERRNVLRQVFPTYNQGLETWFAQFKALSTAAGP